MGVSYGPGQPGTGSVAKDDLGFLILQPPPFGAGIIKVCRQPCRETKVVTEHASGPRLRHVLHGGNAKTKLQCQVWDISL